MGHADALDGPAVRPLADARRRPRRDAAGGPRTRHLRRAGLAGHRPVPDGGRRPAWPAADPRVERLPGAQRPDLRDPPRPSGRVVPQPGRGQLADGRSGRAGGSTCRTSTRRCRSRRTPTRSIDYRSSRDDDRVPAAAFHARLPADRPARAWRSTGASRPGRPLAGGSSRRRRTDRSAARRSGTRRGRSSRPTAELDVAGLAAAHGLVLPSTAAAPALREAPRRPGVVAAPERDGLRSPSRWAARAPEPAPRRVHVSVRPSGGRPDT